MATENPITKFSATIDKVQTTKDGGVRLTLDIPETDHDAINELIKLKFKNAALKVALQEFDA